MEHATDQRERRALWASVVVLATLVVLQAPGRIVPETKLDITLDPVGYLSRALTAWDPTAGLGRVQNQAIGYLFPMGAFSTALHSIGVSPWLTQRLWIALVMVMGLWGAHRVARAIGIGSASGRLAAGWAYALAPATVSLVAFQSAGQVPYALIPHALVPLLTARTGDAPRRVAARSALWIAAMGGVNGASAFAVLPLVVIWFATREPGRDRRRLLGWWVAGAIAATLWWLIPLLVSVRYGIRFTDYTEQSSVTTITESTTEVLRGTGNWLSYVQSTAGRWLPGAWALTADRVAVVGSVLAAAIGLGGLARRDAPARTWLITSLLAGTVAMGMGYGGPWGGGASSLVQDLLDGPLVAFRNVHKFSALVHLPLALGLGHLVTVAITAARVRRTATPPTPAAVRLRLGVAAVALVAVVVAVVPAATQLTAPGSFDAVPGSWQRAATWLRAHDGRHRTLLLPGSAFGEYRWGRPLDEPISALGGVDWAVRDLIPLGGNGSTRLLDGIDRAFEAGTLPPGTLTALQRAGVGYLVVRNDLDLVRTGGPRPATVRAVLETEPRLERVASFGPVTVDPGRDDRLGPQPGAVALDAFRDIDVYRVPDPADRLTAYPAAGSLVVSGGQEALLQLDPELVAGRATVLAVDVDGSRARRLPGAVAVATDSARRRDVSFGKIRDNASATLEASGPAPATGEPPQDRWPGDDPSGLTTARLDGAATLAESTQPSAPQVPESQPFAAFDGNPTTTWTASVGGVGEWLEVELDRALSPGTVRVQVPNTTGLRIGAIRVTTDAGSRTVAIGDDGRASIDPPAGRTTRIRLTIAALAGAVRTDPVGLSEVTIEGVAITRPLEVPDPLPRGADVVALQRDRTDPFALRRRDEDGTLDRTFRWDGGAQVTLAGTATPVPGPALDALVARTADGADGAVAASASSRFRDQPGLDAWAVLDGDPLTAWVSGTEAGAPALTLSWEGALPVAEVRVDVLDALSGPGLSAVDAVEVIAGGRTIRQALPADGRITVPAITTDRLTLRFPGPSASAGRGRRVGIAEVEVPALIGRPTVVPDLSAAVDLPCGDGPAVVLDGAAIATTASTTAGELLDAGPIAWRACELPALAGGGHRLGAAPGALLVSTAVLAPSGPGAIPAAPTDARRASVTSWDSEHRSARLGAGPATVVATTENANDGWEATFDGARLEPLRVDGWRQGWIVPAGAAGRLDLRYRPGATQRRGLAVGVVALAGLVAAAVLAGRRRSAGAPWSPPGERSWPTWVVVAGLVVCGFLIGGFSAVAVVGLAAVQVRGRPSAMSWVAAGALVAAGGWTFVQAGAAIESGQGSFAPFAQGFAVVAVLAVGASLLPQRTAPPRS